MRVAGICFLAFLVLCGYELSRSTVESVFLGDVGSDGLPWAWAVVAVVVTAVVVLYNAAAARMRLTRLLAVATTASAALLALLAALRAARVPGSSFALYVWKDVHIVVLLEILWTFANVVFALRTARWVYGLFCVSGSLGGLFGGLLVGLLADRYGTEVALWSPLPVLLILLGATLLLGPRLEPAATRPPGPPAAAAPFGDAVRLLRESRYLVHMVLLIGLVQVAITLVDWQYNAVVESAFPDLDERTAVIGRVYAGINVAAMALQLLTGLLLRIAGVPLTLLAIPALLAIAVSAFAAAPRFLTMAITKVASKALDYSLFKAAKEILYIPLSYAEKTRGKAVIDILTYRVAKGGASLLLGAALLAGLEPFVPYLLLALLVAWFAVTLVITRRYRRLVPRERELA